MATDISRIRSNPLLDLAGVTLKQGAVLLDADFNELVDTVDRRLRALASDVLGRSTVSQTTPHAFKLSAIGGSLMIGRGRLYVDGLLAENHGAPVPTTSDPGFDPLLAEPAWSGALRYDQQPYLPASAPPLPTGGRHLVYLDVWQRELTHLERPDLVEVAVGVDTSARVQTVWQVKVLAADAGNASCATPDAELAGWAALIAPSSGRLSTGSFTPPASPDPCELPPSGDYQGLENQTYRVEIHTAGQPGGSARFKWSRENASVGSRVEAVISDSELQLQTLGRDAVLGLATGDWVEIIDEPRELLQQPGAMRRITVDPTTRRIRFSPALPADLLPGAAPDPDFPARRHLRVRRWDQKGKVLQASANTPVFHDLDAPAADGSIPVPAPGTVLMLEHGVTVRFDSVGSAGFKVGDHWVFAARTADASVEPLEQAPPRGIHHHYARLGIWTVGAGDPTDCRTPWPPRGGDGHDCSCSTCVTPEQQASGVWTLQAAVDQLRETGGTVCLEAGTYALSEPVRLNGLRSLRIRGQGSATVVVSPGGAFDIRDGLALAISDLTVLSMGQPLPNARLPAPAIAAHNVLGLDLQRLNVAVLGASDAKLGGTAIGLGGVALGVKLLDSHLLAPHGLVAPGGAAAPAGTAPVGTAAAAAATAAVEPPETCLLGALTVANNLLWCAEHGLLLQGIVHAMALALNDNTWLGGRAGALVAQGLSLPGAACTVRGNHLGCEGPGLVLGLDGLDVAHNHLLGRPASPNDALALAVPGIALVPGLNPAGTLQAQLLGNQIQGFRGPAMDLGSPVAQLGVAHNQVQACGQGLIVSGDARLGHASVTDNQLQALGAATRESKDPVAGIELARTERATVSGNRLSGIGQALMVAPYRAGLVSFGTRALRADANQVDGIGPAEEFSGLAAGLLVGAPFRQADLAHNQVERDITPVLLNRGKADWQALRVMQATETGRSTRLGRHASVALDFQRSLVFGLNRPYLAATGTAEDTSGASRLGQLAVLGNALAARGGTPAVQVDASDDLQFSDNRVNLAGNGQPAVRLQANAMVVSSNRVRGGETSIELNGNTKRATVLGNLTTGAISPQLGAPWDGMNLRG